MWVRGHLPPLTGSLSHTLSTYVGRLRQPTLQNSKTKLFAQLSEGLSPVTDPVFRLIYYFSERLGKAILNKERIVSETTCAFGLQHNFAFASAVGQLCLQFEFVRVADRRRVLTFVWRDGRQGYNTMEPGSSFFGRAFF